MKLLCLAGTEVGRCPLLGLVSFAKSNRELIQRILYVWWYNKDAHCTVKKQQDISSEYIVLSYSISFFYWILHDFTFGLQFRMSFEEITIMQADHSLSCQYKVADNKIMSHNHTGTVQ